MKTLTDPFGNVTTWQYDHIGRALSQTTQTATTGKTFATQCIWGVSNLAGDVSTAPTYLQKLHETAGNQTWDYELTHTYLSQIQNQVSKENNAQTGNTAFEYDLRGRLRSENTTMQAPTAASVSDDYIYDGANNIASAHAPLWTINNNNQVTAAPATPAAPGLPGLPGTGSLSYDAGGNATAVNGTALAYDGWGDMVGVGTTTYTYDSAGRRVSKTVGAQTTYFVYDGDTLLAEMDAGGQVTRFYVWGALGLISDSAARPLAPLPAQTSATHTLTGTITLEGCVAASVSSQPVTFEFASVDVPNRFLSRTVTLGPNGAFTLTDIPADVYILHIKGAKWLAANLPLDVSTSDAAGLTATLLAGDATDDNSVDIGDFGVVVNGYGSANTAGSGYDASADFTCDGSVDIADFGLLVNNFGSQGAPLPPSAIAGSFGNAPDRFYLFDGMGNLRILLDASGSVAGRGAYSAWGTPLAGYAPPTPFGYRERWAQYRDAETGLLHCGARYYAPMLGRWLSRDPSGFACGPNLYAYCADDPADLFDATGCAPERNEDADEGGGGFANGVDDWLMDGSAKDLGNTLGRFDAGKTNGWDVARAAVNCGVNVVSAACLIKDVAKVGLNVAKRGSQLVKDLRNPETIGCFVADTPVAGFASGGAGATGSMSMAPLSALDGLLAGSALPASSAPTMQNSFGVLPSVSASDAPKYAIQDYRAGDWIASRNVLSGQTEWKQIEQVSVRQTDAVLVVHLADSQSGVEVQTLTTTRQHPFYVEGKGFVAAGALAIGNAIVTRAGPTLVVGRIEWLRRPEGWTVYNFVVADDHSYFVGTAQGGVWVHNGPPCPDSLGPNANGLPRPEPVIENGNSNTGWQHIDERHVTGNSSKGPGDLFPPGTTRAQLEETAQEVTQKGVRVSEPNQPRQIFQRRVKINGVRKTVRVVVHNGKVVTMFPVESE